MRLLQSSYSLVGRLTKAFEASSAFLNGMPHARTGTVLPRCLLVDDDLGYGRLLMAAASRERIPMNQLRSLRDSGFLHEWKFDVSIVHCEYGREAGPVVLQRLGPLLEGVPIVLTTDYEYVDLSEWPASVKRSVPKTAPLGEVLSAAMEAFVIARSELKKTKEENGIEGPIGSSSTDGLRG